MNKSGWRDLIARYYAATTLVHDKDQFKSKLRQLKHLWNFINDLRKGTGLGRRDDGSILATDAWWDSRTVVCNQSYVQSCTVKMLLYNDSPMPVFQGHPEWKKLKDGWPPYLDDLDRMFAGNAVDGSTSFCPSQSNTVDGASSDDDSNDEHDDQLTPLSVGTKRASSTSTTASSPSKRSKSPAVRTMDAHMKEHNEISRQRLEDDSNVAREEPKN